MAPKRTWCDAPHHLHDCTELQRAMITPITDTTAESSLARDARQTSAEHGKIAPGEIAIGVVIGRASEYFDFFVYGIASALVFPSVFFPFEKGLEATLLSFVVFSFAFIARPIGTILFMQQFHQSRRPSGHRLFCFGRQRRGIFAAYSNRGMTSSVLSVDAGAAQNGTGHNAKW